MAKAITIRNYKGSDVPSKITSLTLNEPATMGRIMDRVEVKLDLTSDQ
jgi:hypothetical protein